MFLAVYVLDRYQCVSNRMGYVTETMVKFHQRLAILAAPEYVELVGAFFVRFGTHSTTYFLLRHESLNEADAFQLKVREVEGKFNP